MSAVEVSNKSAVLLSPSSCGTSGSLKEFWSEKADEWDGITNALSVLAQIKQDLGLFFWRSAIRECKVLKYSNSEIKHMFEIWLFSKDSALIIDMPKLVPQELLYYAEECLGTDQVKELIKGLK